MNTRAVRLFSDYDLPRFEVLRWELQQDTLWPWGKTVWLTGALRAFERFPKKWTVRQRHIGYLCTDRPVLKGKSHEEDGAWSFRVDAFLSTGMEQIEQDI